MSELRMATRAPSFFDLYSSGEAAPDDIEAFVGRWHEDMEPWAKDMPLHEYLGLTDEEYGVWVCDPYALPHILAARRSGRELAAVMAERLDEMRRVSDPLDRSILFALGNWVKARSGQ